MKQARIAWRSDPHYGMGVKTGQATEKNCILEGSEGIGPVKSININR